MSPINCIYLYIFMLIAALLILSSIIEYKSRVSIAILGMYVISSVAGLFFYINVDGILRDFSNLTIEPFIYLMICLLLSLFPIIRYDASAYSQILATNEQEKLLYKASVFILLCSIEPFLENILYLPNSLGRTENLALQYGNRQEYLSWLGGKLQLLCGYCSLISPVLLFYYINNYKEKKWIIYGLILNVLNSCIHSFNLGGRSGLVQTFFYLFIVYLIMERYIKYDIKKTVRRIGVIIISFMIVLTSIITIARFNSSKDNPVENVWVWASLYAGEGPINFNSRMWHIKGSTNGDNTFVALRYLLGLTTTSSVEDNWEINEKLGIAGNVFYTYIGFIYADYHKVGTIFFLFIIAIIMNRYCIPKRNIIQIQHVIGICIWAKALFSGMTFYCYMNFRSNFILLYTIIFCLILSMYGKKTYYR